MGQPTLQQIFQSAVQHQLAGRLPQAIELYRHVIGVAPGLAEAHSNMGVALFGMGRLDEAIAAYERAITANPNYADAYNNLGNALNLRGRFDEAIVACRRAVEIRPSYAQAYNNLGIALVERGEPRQGIDAYRTAISLDPNYAEAYSNLGHALRLCDESSKAIEMLERAIALRPQLAGAHSNLSGALIAKGDFVRAIESAQRAIVLDSKDSQARNHLGVALLSQSNYPQAIAAFEACVALDPHNVGAYSNLGTALLDSGLQEQGVDRLREAVAHNPGSVSTHSSLCLAMHYSPTLTPGEIFGELKRWDRMHAATLRPALSRYLNDPAPERRLRIGYVSPDFRSHAVAHMVMPLIASHDRSAVEVYCYAQVPRPDTMTSRFQQHADHWRDVTGLSDGEMTELITRDGIDILVDLAGHTAGNRLLVFARKPAPIQITWMGFPNGTGLAAMDYRMSDSLADPSGASDSLYVEQLIRLDPTNWVYEPPVDSPEPTHVTSENSLTFGCFNDFAKVTEPMLRLWARILRNVAGSRLLLKARSLGVASVRERVSRIYCEEGISSDRIEFLPWTKTAAEHFALYNRVAIALDPFPYHGTTTTCEALWMSTPVVTLAGQSHVSRVGVSLLTNMGLADLIASEPDRYVRICVELANDRARLNELHQGLRIRMLASSLMDRVGFAGKMEAAYRRTWRGWCASFVS